MGHMRSSGLILATRGREWQREEAGDDGMEEQLGGGQRREEGGEERRRGEREGTEEKGASQSAPNLLGAVEATHRGR
eukprot:1570867-Rhodomonas_salina.1